MVSISLVQGGGQDGGTLAVHVEMEEDVCLLLSLVRNPSRVLGLGRYSGSFTVDSEGGRGERGKRGGGERKETRGEREGDKRGEGWRQEGELTMEMMGEGWEVTWYKGRG